MQKKDKINNILNLHFRINPGFKDTYLLFIKLLLTDEHLLSDSSLRRPDLSRKIHAGIRILITDYVNSNKHKLNLGDTTLKADG